MVTRSPLIAMTWVLTLTLGCMSLCGMSFTFHSQCVMVLSSALGFLPPSEKLEIILIIRPTGLARTCLGDVKSMALSCQIIGLRPKHRGAAYLGNPGCATGMNMKKSMSREGVQTFPYFWDLKLSNPLKINYNRVSLFIYSYHNFTITT